MRTLLLAPSNLELGEVAHSTVLARSDETIPFPEYFEHRCVFSNGCEDLVPMFSAPIALDLDPDLFVGLGGDSFGEVCEAPDSLVRRQLKEF